MRLRWVMGGDGRRGGSRQCVGGKAAGVHIKWDNNKRLGPVGEQESPKDSWPIRKDFREIVASCGSSGTFTVSRRNQLTVDDRQGLTKRFALNGFNT